MKSILLPIAADEGFERRRVDAHLTCLQTFPDAALAVSDFGAPALYIGDLLAEVRKGQAEQRAAVEAHLSKEDVPWDWVQHGIDPAQAQRIMDEAHKTCPYSKALRGDTAVKLMVD